jgi:large subunit ribosomal protein L25
MEQIELEAMVRDVKGKKVKRLRREDLVPAVLYGKHLEQPLCLMMYKKPLVKVLSSTDGGRGVLFTLNIKNGETRKEYAVLQDIQYHPYKLDIIHIDWHGISLEEEITTTVPIILKGEAVGTKVGGVLEVVLEEIEIRCLPKDLPPHIEVDITNLNVGESIHIRDLSLPEGITLVSSGDEVIATVVAPRVEEEITAPAEGEAQVQEETTE